MPKKPVTQKQSDVVTNRIMLVITTCFVAFALLIYLSRLLSRVDFAKYALPFLNTLIGVSAAFVVFALGRMVMAGRRGVDYTQKVVSGKGLLGAALVTLLAALVIRFYNFDGIRALYIFIPVLCALYIIYYVYQRDFFMLAIWAVLGVGGFWVYYKTMDYVWLQGKHALISGIAAGVALLMAVLLLVLKRRDGVLTFGGTDVQVMPRKGLYAPIYILLGLIAVGMVLVIPYRTLAAYYAALALGGYAFICAVIYTIKLMYD